MLDPDTATGQAKDMFERVKSYYRMVPPFREDWGIFPRPRMLCGP